MLNSPEEHIAHVGGVKSERKGTSRAASGAEQAAEYQLNTLQRTLNPQAGVEDTDDQDDDGAHCQADEDGDQRSQHRFGTLFL